MDNFRSRKKNILKDKSYTFALNFNRAFNHLMDNKSEYICSKQLIRSGTSIEAQIEEVNQVLSKAVFIHKLSIANKEAVESNYWIRLLIDSEILYKSKGEGLLKDSDELIKISMTSIKTSITNK
jgi:four helix bundle protein